MEKADHLARSANKLQIQSHLWLRCGLGIRFVTSARLAETGSGFPIIPRLSRISARVPSGVCEITALAQPKSEVSPL